MDSCELCWVKLCSLWKSRDTYSDPHVGTAVLAHYTSRAGDLHFFVSTSLWVSVPHSSVMHTCALSCIWCLWALLKGFRTEILLSLGFLVIPVPVVDKKPRFYSTKCLSQLFKLLRTWSQFICRKIDDVCKIGTLQWTGQEAPLYM